MNKLINWAINVLKKNIYLKFHALTFMSFKGDFSNIGFVFLFRLLKHTLSISLKKSTPGYNFYESPNWDTQSYLKNLNLTLKINFANTLLSACWILNVDDSAMLMNVKLSTLCFPWLLSPWFCLVRSLIRSLPSVAIWAHSQAFKAWQPLSRFIFIKMLQRLFNLGVKWNLPSQFRGCRIWKAHALTRWKSVFFVCFQTNKINRLGSHNPAQCCFTTHS